MVDTGRRALKSAFPDYKSGEVRRVKASLGEEGLETRVKTVFFDLILRVWTEWRLLTDLLPRIYW